MRLILLNKIRGFVLIEILLTVSLISIVTGGFFYLYNSAESSRLISTAKTEVQSEVRRAMDWIVNDLRQTTTASIGNNLPPSPSTHIKFRKVTGFSVKADGSETPDFGDFFIEYTYDPDSKTIIRTDPSQPPGSWSFNNIVIQLEDNVTHLLVDHPIFNTRLLDGSIVPIASGLVITERNLVIEIVGKKEVKLPLSVLDVVYILKEEVYMRN